MVSAPRMRTDESPVRSRPVLMKRSSGTSSTFRNPRFRRSLSLWAIPQATLRAEITASTDDGRGSSRMEIVPENEVNLPCTLLQAELGGREPDRRSHRVDPPRARSQFWPGGDRRHLDAALHGSSLRSF